MRNKTLNKCAPFCENRYIPGVCLFLVITTIIVYLPIRSYEFVNFDDNVYLTENPHVQGGITPDNITWAFGLHGSGDRNYWHPLTWVSHMLDWQLFGKNAGLHHLENLLIHIINALLLFFALKQMTGAPRESAFAAALFALHPINVDSVAWIAEKKNILSTLFWMLTMLAYGYYSKRPSIPRYLIIVVAMTLGLISKPMLVTLPCVLLLMDYWPLGRFSFIKQEHPDTLFFEKRSTLHLVLEKIPLLILSFVAIGLSVTALENNNNLIGLDMSPLSLRLENSLVSYINYIVKIIWPHNLAVYYPYPHSLPLWQVAGAGITIIGLSIIFMLSARKAPYLIVGWLWFIGTLLPVIGIIQTGLWPAMADRWAYVPAVGIFIMISWGGSALVEKRNRLLAAKHIIPAIIILSLMVISSKQVSYWKNSMTLFEHAVKVTSNNDIAHNGLGRALYKQGRTQEAISQYLEALRINPHYADAHNNLGIALVTQGYTDEAIGHYLQALRINPNYAKAHINMGCVLDRQGRTQEAISQYLEALRIDPGVAEAHYNLGIALKKQGRTQEAINQYLEALRLKPDYADAHNNLGIALVTQGHTDEAIGHYLQALRIKPGYAEAHVNLGDALDRQGRTQEAIRHYSEALRINPDVAEADYNMGNALMRQGHTQEAIKHYLKALRLKPDDADAHNNLGAALAKQGRTDEAIGHYLQALRSRPGYVGALNNLGLAHIRKGNIDEAITDFRKALQIKPDDVNVKNNLNNALMLHR